jgi:hypothetical protein
MNPKEHVLLLTILTKQAQQTKLLLDILKSRGVLSEEDARVFEFAANVDTVSNVALFEQAKAKYLELAQGLGIETGLETLPPLSGENFQPENP